MIRASSTAGTTGPPVKSHRADGRANVASVRSDRSHPALGTAFSTGLVAARWARSAAMSPGRECVLLSGPRGGQKSHVKTAFCPVAPTLTARPLTCLLRPLRFWRPFS